MVIVALLPAALPIIIKTQLISTPHPPRKQTWRSANERKILHQTTIRLTRRESAATFSDK